MNCDDTQSRLSAWHDGELPAVEATELRRHLDSCPACRRELAALERISHAARGLPTNGPASDVWPRIVAGLTDEAPGCSPTVAPLPNRSSRRRIGVRFGVALALSALFGVGVFVWNRVVLDRAQQRRVANIFDRYLEEFQSSPLAAQRLLDEAFPSKTAAAPSERTSADHSPANASMIASRRTLPGLTRVAMHVRTLPCCDCVQGLYQREDGSCVAVFEQRMPTQWETDGGTREVRCGNCVCRLRQRKSPVTASWNQNSRYFTVVGVTDETELKRIVKGLE